MGAMGPMGKGNVPMVAGKGMMGPQLGRDKGLEGVEMCRTDVRPRSGCDLQDAWHDGYGPDGAHGHDGTHDASTNAAHADDAPRQEPFLSLRSCSFDGGKSFRDIWSGTQACRQCHSRHRTPGLRHHSLQPLKQATSVEAT